MKSALIVFLCIIILGAGAVFLAQRDIPAAPVVTPDLIGPPISESKTYTMLFAGDIMLDRSVRRQIEREQDPLYPFVRIADTLRSADITFANLEGPVSARGKDQGSIFSFRFEPVGTMNSLKFAGFDVVNLANNHIWDWGVDALTDTVQHLDNAGIGHIGAGRTKAEANTPFITQLGDTKIAMLGYTTLYPRSLEAVSSTPGISSFRLASTTEQIQELKVSGLADLVVVSFHWGIEYEMHSTSSEQIIARALIDSGADLIIGHHPHAIQEVEEYKGKYIAYSLGNFVFDQNLSRFTMKGLMVRASMKDKKIESLEEIPVQLTPTFQPYIGQSGDPELEAK
jgi:poly-gamma-glutamate synthesis protein (capsule biosynthesis protein)